MSACYRCETITSGSGEPIGVCDMCSAFACDPCGARIPHVRKFRCGICWPAVLLLSSGIKPGPEGGPGGSGSPTAPGGAGGGGGGGAEAPLFKTREEFEMLVPSLATPSGQARRDWQSSRVVEKLLRIHSGEGIGVVDKLVAQHREERAEEPSLVMLDSIGAGMRLAEQVDEAVGAKRLNAELLADGLGVASWAIDVVGGKRASPDRLALLPDARITFVVGFLSPAYA